ncbi:MAG: fused MFS/spermidine synthase [Leptothrix ochracea]|uniref:fused MFS/spermidine synthase n=2 Tax=Leptothrix ochracea TaxID=735331 RepID=UPI0034E254B8
MSEPKTMDLPATPFDGFEGFYPFEDETTVETEPTLEITLDTPFVYASDEVVSLHFDIMAIQSAMRLEAPDALDLDYTRVMMGFLLLADTPPTRILMIGLGGGSLVKYCYRHLPQACITVVEINPQVIAVRDDFFIPADDERLRVVCGDGAAFVRDEDETHDWDLILVDGFTREGQPEALCSASFYAHCHAALAPEGLMVVNMQADDSAVLETRIDATFDSRSLSVPSERDTNRILFASRAAPWQPNPARIQARWHKLDPVHQTTLAATRTRLRRVLKQTMVPAVSATS